MALIRIEEPKLHTKTPLDRFALFGLGFRPFFLLAAALAALLVPLWIGMFSGKLSIAPVLPGMVWHGHEMVFGFAGAVIAGFLLTAVQTWTGQPMPSGGPLAALVALWFGGRLFQFSEMPVVAVVIDVSFLPVVALVVARALFRSNNARNYFIPLLLLALAFANGMSHAGALGWLEVSPLTGLHLAVALITMLETVIAGRIVPSFTANALRTVPWNNTWVDRLAVASTGLAFLMWAVDADVVATAVVAALAAGIQCVRVWGWRPLPTIHTPLLWILHLSHAWIIVALIVLVVAGAGLTTSQPVLHLLTVGATGGLIISMITRTALGHTGRLLRTGWLELICYLLLQCAIVLRVLPLLGIAASAYIPLMWASSLAWAGCFGLYLIKYVPILIRPRVDGKPG